ncbi:SPASM domain-containing protein [Marinihelvus fidelis]|nr:radical SAM protein [Marinihelvus fidelis]
MSTRTLFNKVKARLARLSWGQRVRLSRLKTRLFGAPSLGSQGDAAPLAGRFCPNPFKQVDLMHSGACYTCCSAWLPTPMGNVKHQSMRQLWNGPVMQKIRESIYDGSFRYCNHERCPVIQNGELPSIEEAEKDPVYGDVVKARATTMDTLPTFINMVNDASCNLYCPSCRTERVVINEGKAFDRIAEIQERFLADWLAEPNEADFTLSITGSGDPFASRAYRELLYTLDGNRYPNMKIALQTNGVLLTPRNWKRMEGVHGNISSILVSFDAATADTYAITRRGGHWATLMANCERLGQLRRHGEIRNLRYDFVVQAANYREMPAFVELARRLGADRAYFSRLVDWGTWPKREFEAQCPWRPEHPEHEAFLAVMADPALDDPFVDLGNMTQWREKALQNRLQNGLEG